MQNDKILSYIYPLGFGYEVLKNNFVFWVLVYWSSIVSIQVEVPRDSSKLKMIDRLSQNAVWKR